jgi:hypothetical protein
MTEREKLKREIVLLDSIVKTNASVLKSKAMNADDREALQRQMARRLAHRKLLQQRLDRLFKIAGAEPARGRPWWRS